MMRNVIETFRFAFRANGSGPNDLPCTFPEYGSRIGAPVLQDEQERQHE
jgi:hypothetical protein